jgi:hypothetical protein
MEGKEGPPLQPHLQVGPELSSWASGAAGEAANKGEHGQDAFELPIADNGN